MVPFHVQKLLSETESQLPIFNVVAYALGVLAKVSLPKLLCCSLSPVLSCSKLTASVSGFAYISSFGGIDFYLVNKVRVLFQTSTCRNPGFPKWKKIEKKIDRKKK